MISSRLIQRYVPARITVILVKIAFSANNRKSGRSIVAIAHPKENVGPFSICASSFHAALSKI